MRERKYFEINENSARVAHNNMSMSDYNAGSATRGYQANVNEVYKIAEEIAEKKPRQTDRAYFLAERYARKMAENINKENRIGCMCPSVLISGAGNFPVRKKEKQIAAWDKNYQEYNEIQKIKSRLYSMLNEKEPILSGDEDAIERLEDKLEQLISEQEKMKAANKAIRMKDTVVGDEKLKYLGFTDKEIKELREPDYCGCVGYSSYHLSNNNANIRRVQQRLEQLKKAKENGNQETENNFCKVVENSDIMRLQLFFDEKPEENTRTILKGHGFRWSPKNGCWQRQLTPNAKYALNIVLEKLKKLETMSD